MSNKWLYVIVFATMVAAGSAQAGGDPARGEQLSLDCADCHGARGEGDGDMSPIAGLEVDYHVEQLKAYKSGERTDEDEMMIMYVEDLSEQDMLDLAAYYATLSAD